MKRLRGLLGIPHGFEARHLRRQEHFREDYALLARSLLRRVEFRSAVDVGCSIGLLIGELRKAGKEVHGIELSKDVHHCLPPELQGCVEVGDFSQVQGEWDLGCCIEMAEHIQAKRSEDLVETLARVSSKRIFFTAAPPGQKGHGHINCRPMADWLGWFAARGWSVDDALTKALKEDLAGVRQAFWLRDNSVLLAPRS